MIDWLTDVLVDVANFFGAERYSQHSICLTNDTLMIALYTIAEGSIAISYLIIGLGFIHTYHTGIKLSPAAKLLFGSFIFLCGAQHATSLLTLYVGVYRLDVLAKCATAAVSAATAASFWKAILLGDSSGHRVL